jgi:hypothetical protein
MVVEMDNFWWEDSSCLASEVQHNAVAAICQYDIAVASTTTTTSAASTTTRIPESTTVTTTTVTPGSSCPSGWLLFEGRCYLVDQKSVATWADAEKDCNNKGGHLASIHSAAESNFIHSITISRDLWIGGTDAAVEVGFTIYIILYKLKGPSASSSLKSPFCIIK